MMTYVVEDGTEDDVDYEDNDSDKNDDGDDHNHDAGGTDYGQGCWRSHHPGTAIKITIMYN